MTNRAIAHARLRNSRLVGAPLETPAEVVGWFGAVQAQDIPGSLWGISQRIGRTGGIGMDAGMAPGGGVGRVGGIALNRDGPTLGELWAALDSGRVVRTHGPRPTWHVLAPEDLRWTLGLVGPRVAQSMASMTRRFGITAGDIGRAVTAMRSAMAGGAALTRPELRDVIASVGIDVTAPLASGIVGMHAELAAVICNGPRRARQPTFVLVDEWVSPDPVPALAAADALRELTIRYFRSHGPALAHDMAWWSGLTVGSVREGLALAGPALVGRTIDGRDYWAAAGAFDPGPELVAREHVLLLPNYDEYLGSYRDYGPIFDAALPRARTVADVLGTHLVVRDGLVVGGWRRALGRDRVTVTAILLMPLAPAELDALAQEVDRFGRFLGLPAALEFRNG